MEHATELTLETTKTLEIVQDKAESIVELSHEVLDHIGGGAVIIIL